MSTRREFLAAGAAAAFGAAAATAVSHSVEASPGREPRDPSGLGAGDPGRPLAGRLLVAGFGAKRFSANGAAPSSVITELALADGSVRQSWIELPSAHSVIPAPGGELLVLPLDGRAAALVGPAPARQGRKLARLVPAPTGYLYSGHGVMSRDGRHAFVSLRRESAKLPTDTGRIGVLDTAQGRLAALYDSGAVRPHDLALIDGGTTLVISHYGDLNYETAGKTNSNVREPRIVTMSADTGTVRQIIVAPAAGSLTHLAVDREGMVCAVPLNYFGLDEAGRRAVERRLAGRPFELSVAEELEGRIAEPMPVYLASLATGEIRTLNGDPARQRRAQSVAYHAGANRFFATYTFSDTLACIDEAGITYRSAFELGLSYLRGVCAVGDTDLIAVTGQFRGVALVDARALTVVKRLDVALFDNPHVTWTPA